MSTTEEKGNGKQRSSKARDRQREDAKAKERGRKHSGKSQSRAPGVESGKEGGLDKSITHRNSSARAPKKSSETSRSRRCSPDAGDGKTSIDSPRSRSCPRSGSRRRKGDEKKKGYRNRGSSTPAEVLAENIDSPISRASPRRRGRGSRNRDETKGYRNQEGSSTPRVQAEVFHNPCSRSSPRSADILDQIEDARQQGRAADCQKKGHEELKKSNKGRNMVFLVLLLVLVVVGVTTLGGGDTHNNNDSSKLNFSNSEQQDVELPFRKYGYRSTPFSWEELNQIIVKEKNLAKLSRSVSQEQGYQRALVKQRQEWRSTKDKILHSKFNLPMQLDKETQLYFVDETSANQQGQGVLRKLVPNDFPYYCAPGIGHWVLWKYGANSAISSEDIDWAKESLLQLPSSTNDGGNVVEANNMISWENPPDMKSLPEINHVHILLRHNPNANPKLRRKGWLE